MKKTYRELSLKLYERLESFILPGFKYPLTFYEELLTSNTDAEYVWLDLGCGHNILPPWRGTQEVSLTKKVRTVIGIDYSLNSLMKHKTINNKVRGDITRLPFSDESFHLITSNMVFEHLDQPEVQLKEIARILKPGGILIFHTPNLLGFDAILSRLIPGPLKKLLVYILEGRKEEDLFQTYYRINTPQKIADYANKVGFNIIEINLICSSAEFVNFLPIAFFELLWIRLLLTNFMKKFRTNIIVSMKKSY